MSISRITVARGLLDPATFHDVHAFVQRHFRFALPRQVTASELIAASRRDKKVSDGAVNLILLERPGNLKIVPVPFDTALEQQVAGYLHSFDAFRGR